MKLTWKNKSKDKKKRSLGALSAFSNLPFDNEIEYQPDEAAETTQLQKEKEKVKEESDDKVLALLETSDSPDSKQLAQSFQAQGNKLAEGGKYREALGKWETALTLIPENAVLHEQKAQVLLEIGDAWNALKAATRATELEPSWAEAWITLGRSQLNFGEPDCAIQSFDRALAIKPDSKETREDRLAALHLVKRRKQLQSSGLSASKNRYIVRDKAESS